MVTNRQGMPVTWLITGLEFLCQKLLLNFLRSGSQGCCERRKSVGAVSVALGPRCWQCWGTNLCLQSGAWAQVLAWMLWLCDLGQVTSLLVPYSGLRPMAALGPQRVKAHETHHHVSINDGPRIWQHSVRLQWSHQILIAWILIVPFVSLDMCRCTNTYHCVNLPVGFLEFPALRRILGAKGSAMQPRCAVLVHPGSCKSMLWSLLNDEFPQKHPHHWTTHDCVLKTVCKCQGSLSSLFNPKVVSFGWGGSGGMKKVGWCIFFTFKHFIMKIFKFNERRQNWIMIFHVPITKFND